MGCTTRDTLLHDLCKLTLVVGGFVEKLKEKFEHIYDEKLLRLFARCRTFHRMRWVQRQILAHHLESLRSKKKKLDFGHAGPAPSPSTSKKVIWVNLSYIRIEHIRNYSII